VSNAFGLVAVTLGKEASRWLIRCVHANAAVTGHHSQEMCYAYTPNWYTSDGLSTPPNSRLPSSPDLDTRVQEGVGLGSNDHTGDRGGCQGSKDTGYEGG
jgi:hypothetical protein